MEALVTGPEVVHVNDIAFVASTLVRGLEAAGHPARLVELPTPGATWPWPRKALTLPLRAAGLAWVAARIRRTDPLLVHVHYASQAVVGLLSGSPYIVHCHGTDIRDTQPGSAWDRAIRPAIGRAAGLLYSTPDLAGPARRLRQDAAFLPNPVDTDRFRPGSPADRDVIVGIRLDATKGADAAFDAIHRLIQARPSTTVTVIQSGSDSERLRAESAPSIRWMPPVPHDEMPGVLGRHRVAVGQFAAGAIGVYELEAMACGVPVIADFTYGEAYADGSPIPALDRADRAGSAAVEIERLLTSADALREASVKARRWTIENHGVPAIVRRLVAYYEALGIRPFARGLPG